MLRIPTDEEYRSFTGNHCFRIWRELSDNWRCPICDRTKRENMRWTKTQWKDGRQVGFHMNWFAEFNRHHDHGADIGFEYVEEKARFDIIIICDLCNKADGLAKRVLKLPENFSFGPNEIKEFIKAKPHTKSHEIDYEKAKEVYDYIVMMTEFGWDWAFAKEKERREKNK
jgi:rubredoxin